MPFSSTLFGGLRDVDGGQVEIPVESSNELLLLLFDPAKIAQLSVPHRILFIVLGHSAERLSPRADHDRALDYFGDDGGICWLEQVRRGANVPCKSIDNLEWQIICLEGRRYKLPHG